MPEHRFRRTSDADTGTGRDVQGSEVGFAARKDGVVEYYRVCQTVMAYGIRRRGYNALRKSDDSFTKTIPTLHRFGPGTKTAHRQRTSSRGS